MVIEHLDGVTEPLLICARQHRREEHYAIQKADTGTVGYDARIASAYAADGSNARRHYQTPSALSPKRSAHEHTFQSLHAGS